VVMVLAVDRFGHGLVRVVMVLVMLWVRFMVVVEGCHGDGYG